MPLRSALNSFLATVLHYTVLSAFDVIIKPIRLKRRPCYCSVSASYEFLLPRITWTRISKYSRCSAYVMYSLHHPIYYHYFETDNNLLCTVAANQTQPQAPLVQNKWLKRAIICIRNARGPVTSPPPPPPPLQLPHASQWAAFRKFVHQRSTNETRTCSRICYGQYVVVPLCYCTTWHNTSRSHGRDCTQRHIATDFTTWCWLF